MKALLALVVFLGVCVMQLHAADTSKPEYLRFFDPAQGFKPAQTNLTNIFLQLAGSLEHYASPEQYLRHVAAEQKRVAAKYKAKTGNDLTGHFPAHITDAYIDQLAKNWNLLSPKLHLDGLAKDAGLCTREAIRGTRDSGTILVELFNQHQQQVANAMQGGSGSADFEVMKAMLFEELELTKEEVAVNGYEIARRDAVSYGQIFRGVLAKFYRNLDATLKPEMASKLKTVINSVFLDLGRMAHSELEIGILDASLR